MATVNVLTINAAAAQLGTYRERVQVMLAAGALSSATINGKLAVLDDPTFRRAVRKAKQASA